MQYVRNIIGVINHLILGSLPKLQPIIVPMLGPRTFGEIRHRPGGKHTTIILLNKCSIKPIHNDLPLNLLISVSDSPHQRSFGLLVFFRW